MTLAGIPDNGLGAEEKPRYGGRLRIGERYAPQGLDAHRNQDHADYKRYCLMYGALTEQGKLPQVEIHPMLAKSWEISHDGREYTFSLREGVTFHHGKAFDSGDVKYSIERVMNPATRSPRAFAFKWVDSIHVIDKYNLTIKLKEPFGPFLSSLTLTNCPIIPAGWEPTAMKPAPGTGPFVFKSFIPNEITEFTRFGQYYEFDKKTGNRLPYVDNVTVRKIVDETVRLTALRAGDLDFAETPSLNVMAKAILEKPIPGITMGYGMPGNQVIFFNLTKPPFENKKVRHAVAYALDKKEILKAAFWGLGETINNQPFLKESRFYIPVQDRDADVAQAKQLLAEAGYPNGFEIDLFEFSDAAGLAAASVVIGQLQKVGIRAAMQVIDRAPYYTAMRKGDYRISYGAISERFDWDDAYYQYFHSNEIGKNNWSRYKNKEVDDLLEKGRTTWKTENRVPFYKNIIEILKEDLPLLYCSKGVVGYAFRDNLKGFREGFTTRPAWHEGGVKYWWLEK